MQPDLSALLCIFVDHIPGDALNWVTLRNLGFSDAAELFVLLAGFAIYDGVWPKLGARGRQTRPREDSAALWVLALIGKLVLATFQAGWVMQALINGVGFAGMFGVAWLLEGARKRPPPLTPAIGGVGGGARP